MAKSESTKGSNLVWHPFGPLYDEQSRVLILGSFPSVKSREQQFFYGHPKNRFGRCSPRSQVLKSRKRSKKRNSWRLKTELRFGT